VHEETVEADHLIFEKSLITVFLSFDRERICKAYMVFSDHVRCTLGSEVELC